MPPITDLKVDCVAVEVEDQIEAEIVVEAERLAEGVSDGIFVPTRELVDDGPGRLEITVTPDGLLDFEDVVVELAVKVPLLVDSEERDDELPLAMTMEPAPSAVKVVVGIT